MNSLRLVSPVTAQAGKGDGPAASHLARRPADLTKLSVSNGGVFPFVRVFEMIDGRLDVVMHGPREMPVWGDRYKREVMSTAPAGSLTDETANLWPFADCRVADRGAMPWHRIRCLPAPAA